MSDINQILKGIIAVQNRTLSTIKQVIIQKQYPEDLTKMGNQFNGVQQLVKLNSEGKIPVQLLNDYTAFEVMPNNETIQVGTLSDVKFKHPDTKEENTLKYLKGISACTIHKMTLRSHQEPEDCDVVIDWGDGTVEAIKDMTWTTATHTVGKSYELSHDYSAVAGKDENGQWKKFIVKIYGKDYYTFRHNSYTNNNLISRIFDIDLPIASHIGNFASMAICAYRLLKVEFPHSASPYSDVWNWNSCFSNCTNLQYVFGFVDLQLRDDANLGALFQGDTNLIDTDFVYPAGITKLATTFANCNNLSINICKLFPINGFSSSKITVVAPFLACWKLKYEDLSNSLNQDLSLADKLWNSKTTKFEIDFSSSAKTSLPFSKAFLGDKDGTTKDLESLNKIPVSWGGTASDDIIEKSLEEKYKDLLARIEALENA